MRIRRIKDPNAPRVQIVARVEIGIGFYDDEFEDHVERQLYLREVQRESVAREELAEVVEELLPDIVNQILYGKKLDLEVIINEVEEV